MKKYNLVAVGGTFDRLHKGHVSLLRKTFSIGTQVIIGITSDEMIQDKPLSSALLPFQKRRAELVSFLRKENVDSSVTVVKLLDPYGSLKTNTSIEALVVGPRYTKRVVEDVGESMHIVPCDPVLAEDGLLLSSSRIRKGEVDRTGALYSFPFKMQKLPQRIRPRLRKPLGKVVKGTGLKLLKNTTLLISIGDVSTKKLNKAQLFPDLSIVDLKVQRRKIYKTLDQLSFPDLKRYTKHRVANKPGTLTKELFDAIEESINQHLEHNKKSIVLVEGEDDLAALLCIYRAPPGATVVYGQPPFNNSKHEGLVVVRVNEQKKQEARNLLSQFSS